MPGVVVSGRQSGANLERVRWFQNQLAPETVIVDIAGYRIYYLRDGTVKWQACVQVGREYRPSPVFQSAITHLTLSPAWVVPPPSCWRMRCRRWRHRPEPHRPEQPACARAAERFPAAGSGAA